MDEKQNSKRITVLNALFTCAIVLNHCENAGAAVYNCACIAMGGFFAISGYLLYRDFTLRNYGAKLRRRVFSLLLPYLLWQGIYMLKGALCGAFVWNIRRLLPSLLLVGDILPASQLWYLFAIFLYAVLAPILLPLFRNRYVGAFGGILCVLFVQYIRFHRADPAIARVLACGYVPNILTYFPCYYLGCFMGSRICAENKNDGFGLLCAVLPAAVLNGVFGDDFSAYLLPRAFSVLLVFCLPVGDLLYRSVKRTSFDKITFIIFAVHSAVITDFQPHTDALALRLLPAVANPVSHCMLLLLTAAFSYVAFFVLRKLCPPLLRILSGGRSV